MIVKQDQKRVMLLKYIDFSYNIEYFLSELKFCQSRNLFNIIRKPVPDFSCIKLKHCFTVFSSHFGHQLKA